MTNTVANESGANMGARYAVIDIGSNSIHLAIFWVGKDIQKQLSISEKVQLARGLQDSVLTDEAIQRGLDCLARFAVYLEDIAPSNIRIVATYALRTAKNATIFCERANALLPKPIEIIAGREEARLVYLGVWLTDQDSRQRLVIDIGGGSTEFIIGQGKDMRHAESLSMGCVAYTDTFFAEINKKNFARAIDAATRTLYAINARYAKAGFEIALGSSGTIKAVAGALVEAGKSDGEITIDGLLWLKKTLIELKDPQQIPFAAVKEARKNVFAAGVAILLAAFMSLNIKSMRYSTGALREGALFDMLGEHSTAQCNTVEALMARYNIDAEQSMRVSAQARTLFVAVQDDLSLSEEDGALLEFGARLHEIGRFIAHSGYHKHGAYILGNADMFGFSRAEQEFLARMALVQRKKLKSELCPKSTNARTLCLLLRLAVLACVGRIKSGQIMLAIINDVWCVRVLQDDTDSLLNALGDEVAQFAKWGVCLRVDK